MEGKNDVDEWVRWASMEAFRLMVRYLNGEGRGGVSNGAPTTAPSGATGVVVSFWNGSELRSQAWEEGDARAAVLSLLVEQCCEGTGAYKPLKQDEIPHLSVSVNVMQKRRKLVKGAQLNGTTEGLQSRKHLYTPQQLQSEEAIQEAMTACLKEKAKMDSNGQPDVELNRKWIVQMVVSSFKPDKEFLASQARQQANKKKKGGVSWIWKLSFAVFAIALLYLRFHEATYDVKWDDFQNNYALFGLPVGAPLRDVKKAYHQLSMTQHPDKMGRACDSACEKRWLDISNAYTEIKDYHSGKLKLIGQPTRFDDMRQDD